MAVSDQPHSSSAAEMVMACRVVINYCPPFFALQDTEVLVEKTADEVAELKGEPSEAVLFFFQGARRRCLGAWGNGGPLCQAPCQHLDTKSQTMPLDQLAVDDEGDDNIDASLDFGKKKKKKKSKGEDGEAGAEGAAEDDMDDDLNLVSGLQGV